MKSYIQFYSINLKGTVQQVVGSTGFCSLDGRLSLENMFLQAERIANSAMYTINRGIPNHSHIVYKSAAIQRAIKDGKQVIFN